MVTEISRILSATAPITSGRNCRLGGDDEPLSAGNT